MVEFKARQHRLEIPPAPKSDDPATQKKYSNDLRRLVMDEFNRLASDFHDFKQATYNAAIIPLRSVANVVVTRDQYSMSATWENPNGGEVEPTHVRVRIKEITPNSWATYSYPKSSWSFNGLDPDVQYTLEIQLIARFEAMDTFVSTTRNCPSVPVFRTAESDIKAKVFRTLAGVRAPTSTPANNTNVNFNFPSTETVPGGGAPGAVNSAFCWWGFKFQFRSACAWADTAVSEAFAAGNVGNVTIDTALAPFTTHPNALFRVAHRTICNAIPGAWIFGQPFMAANFANANCVGIVKSASLALPPFSTADLFAIPGACQATGTGLQITDELSDNELFPQSPGFQCIEFVNNEWTLIANNTANTAISNTIYTSLLSGALASIAALTDESDFTLYVELRVLNNALALAGGTGAYTIINLGNKIKIQLIQNTAVFSLQVVVPRDGGGAYVFRGDGIAYNTWVRFYYVHKVADPNGRVLFVNNREVARSANAVLNDFTGIDDTVEISTVNDMRLRALYGWSTALNVETEGIAGYIAGGLNSSSAGTDTVYKLTFVTETVTTLTVLITGDDPGCGFENGGVAGYTIGGLTVRRLDFAAETVSTLAAQPTTFHTYPEGLSNVGVAGYYLGGAHFGPNTNRIDRFAFPAETKSTLGATLSLAASQQSGHQNQGVAGYVTGNVNTADTQVDKLAFSTQTTSVLAVMPAARRFATGLSYSGVAGYVAGGIVSNVSSASILKWAYPSETQSTLGAALNVAITRGAGLENGWSGGGGYVAGGLAPATTSGIRKLAFSNETTSVLAATLPAARAYATGMSNSG